MQNLFQRYAPVTDLNAEKNDLFNNAEIAQE